jgi:phosphatidylserine/phosphatidylglycerophosphate/cardiolipin synthase-like enzyme
MTRSGEDLGGLHDVHARIRGLASTDVWRIFRDRWTEHPAARQAEVRKKLPAMASTVSAPAVGETTVQIARTVPNSTKHPLHGGGPPYAFAPTGDRSVKALVLHAIQQARTYIYLEDQYLVDMSISDALVAAIPHVQKLIILIVGTEGVNEELHEGWARRKRFVDPLIENSAGKVSVCQLGAGRYVHSKTWIFDDKFAIIGSANVNRRGFTHDSEQSAGIFDGNQRRKLTFAHELRMNLWAKHTHLRPIDMLDPIAASVHWERPRPPSDVLPYDPDAGSDGVTPPLLWDIGIDPDGS